MDEFTAIKPCSLLAPYVKHYWFLRTGGAFPSRIRTFPTGYICVMFHRGQPPYSDTAGTFQPRAFISGHGSTFSDLAYNTEVDMACIVFHPVGAAAFLHLPMSEFKCSPVALSDIGDKGFAGLQNLMEDSTSVDACVRKIENFLLDRLIRKPDYRTGRINKAIGLIEKAEPVNIEEIAGQACLSPRQFNRVFSEVVGTGPKEFQRIIRFQRALYLLQTRAGISAAQLAAASGYYDQPHMIKEFKTFSGYTPAQYVDRCEPYSDYFS